MLAPRSGDETGSPPARRARRTAPAPRPARPRTGAVPAGAAGRAASETPAPPRRSNPGRVPRSRNRYRSSARPRRDGSRRAPRPRAASRTSEITPTARAGSKPSGSSGKPVTLVRIKAGEKQRGPAGVISSDQQAVDHHQAGRDRDQAQGDMDLQEQVGRNSPGHDSRLHCAVIRCGCASGWSGITFNGHGLLPALALPHLAPRTWFPPPPARGRAREKR